MNKDDSNNISIKIERKDITTSSVVYKCRVFRDVQLNLSKCRNAMISILQAFSQDARFTEKDRTELFFSLTQLFTSKDSYIHRLLLLLLKEIPVNKHDTLILTHSLSIDISSSRNAKQGQAIRCFCAIIDPGSALSAEKYLQIAITSDVPYTASATLCGALHIIQGGKKDAVLRWLPEIRAAMKSTQPSVRFHALLLLYALKSDDNYAAAQIASSLDNGCSTLEECVTLAFAQRSMKLKSSDHCIELFNRKLMSNSPVVRLEAIRRAPQEMSEKAAEAISPFLNSSTVKMFAAVRTISTSPNIHLYAQYLPRLLTLMKHQNASLAATASICVLKLGDENHVEVVTKRILLNCKRWTGPLLRSVAEEACKFAGKYRNERLTDVAVLLLRISRDQANKYAILRLLLTTEGIPRTQLLNNLSEYLEDWDSVSIARIICDFIASEAKNLPDPSIMIPVLFNRVNLDVATVRMSAINTLAHIATLSEEMKNRILPLLQLFSADEDDSLREEAILYINAISTGQDLSKLFTPFTIDNNEITDKETGETDETEKQGDQDNLFDGDNSFVPASMRHEFDNYGQLEFKTDPVDLTDGDSEFVVSYFVNVYKDYLVIEFLLTNTVEGLTINNVSIQMEDVNIVQSIPADTIKYTQTASLCTVIKRDTPMVFGRFKSSLLYIHDDNEEEWELGEIVLGVSTWITKTKVDSPEAAWESLKQETQVAHIFKIPNAKSSAAGIAKLENALSMQKASEQKDAKKTTLMFYGKDIMNQYVGLMAQLGMSKGEVVCQILVRSSDKQLSEDIIQSIEF